MRMVKVAKCYTRVPGRIREKGIAVTGSAVGQAAIRKVGSVRKIPAIDVSRARWRGVL